VVVLEPPAQAAPIAERWNSAFTFRIIAPYIVEAEAVFTAHHQGHAGWVHGGVVAAVLDEALGRALMSADPGRLMVTAQLELRYFRSIAIGERVTIRGEIVSDRRHLATGVCQALTRDGAVAARADGTLARPFVRPPGYPR
jgi:uncharacterized protein (TIGR00369 family)